MEAPVCPGWWPSQPAKASVSVSQATAGKCPRAAPARPPSHMTRPSSQGLSGAPGQPGTFQPACLPAAGGRATTQGLLQFLPQPEVHEATTHTKGLEAAETPEESGVRVGPPISRGLLVPSKGSMVPCRACPP